MVAIKRLCQSIRDDTSLVFHCITFSVISFIICGHVFTQCWHGKCGAEVWIPVISLHQNWTDDLSEGFCVAPSAVMYHPPPLSFMTRRVLILMFMLDTFWKSPDADSGRLRLVIHSHQGLFLIFNYKLTLLILLPGKIFSATEPSQFDFWVYKLQIIEN